MCARSLIRLACCVFLISYLAACGGGGGDTTNNSGTTANTGGTGGSGTSPPPAYTIGGTLSGLNNGTGISVVLKNGSESLVLTRNGNFTFSTSQVDGSAYDVTVSGQPPFPQKCSITSGGGVIGSANVTNITVTCTATITETELHIFRNTFPGGPVDGATPFAGVIFDSQGNLYGTTHVGGSANDGTVFELVPDGTGGYTQKVLHSFAGGASDGALPDGGVILDNRGILYGTTEHGGTQDQGTVFKLEPDGSGGYTETVLYNFDDGGRPTAGLIMDNSGNMYGTTHSGGGGGSIFQLQPNSSGGYTEVTLYYFKGTSDGAVPNALTLDGRGDLFGTSEAGTVFELQPDGTGHYTFAVIHTLTGDDGTAPEGALMIDSHGNLYGTASGGGTNGSGTVFELQPDGSGGYTSSVLYRFTGYSPGNIGPDGYAPHAGLIMDAQGDLFGTTAYGGTGDAGTVFELMPTGNGGYAESVLYSFSGSSPPGPLAGLTFDSHGNLYGTTSTSFNYGFVFELH